MKTVKQTGEPCNYWVHLKNRPGFRVLGRNLAEAKTHAMMCIEWMNLNNTNKAIYHGISKE